MLTDLVSRGFFASGVESERALRLEVSLGMTESKPVTQPFLPKEGSRDTIGELRSRSTRVGETSGWLALLDWGGK